MLEKNIEKFLVREVKKLGGKAYKFISPGNSGVPDRIVIINNLAPIFVELKTNRGKLSDLQKVQCKKLMGLGQKVEVLYGEDEVAFFIEKLKKEIKSAKL